MFNAFDIRGKFAIFPVLCAWREAETENYNTIHNN